ncbi:MAG: mechanosensitive ion channel protein MscS [Gemmatimonadetes bacterium]|nr:mechanosensitive ion channel protein MscS [Gemmatimonadota bacterium]
MDPFLPLQERTDDLVAILVAIALSGIALVASHGILATALRAFLGPEHSRAPRRFVWRVLLLVWCLLVSGIVAGAAYLMNQGIDVDAAVREWLESITVDHRRSVLRGVTQAGFLVFLTVWLQRRMRRWLRAAEAWAKAYEQITANDEAIEVFFASLAGILAKTLWLVCIVLVVRALALPEPVATLLFVATRIYLIVALGALLAKAVTVVVESLDALSAKYTGPESPLRHYDRLRVLVPLLTRCLEAVIYVGAASLVALQVEAIADLAEWGPRLIQVIGVFFVSRVLVEISELAAGRVLQGKEDLDEGTRKRRETLLPVVKSAFRYAIYLASIVLALSALELNPTPLLAGAGILGLVVGLGAQPLINDIVSGFFILFENLYLVGDFIETGSARGVVEVIDVRTTRIRDPDGQQHILRNGQIGEIINYSKSYTHAVVDVGVAYDSDLDRVYAVLEKVGIQFALEHPDVLAPTVVEGLDGFGESELPVRTITRVRPGTHNPVARELRRRIKVAFDEHDIEIPFARRVLIFDKNDASSPPEMDPRE